MSGTERSAALSGSTGDVGVGAGGRRQAGGGKSVFGGSPLKMVRMGGVSIKYGQDFGSS